MALLADIFENFRTLCHEQYRLDPSHYYTSPGLSWDARANNPLVPGYDPRKPKRHIMYLDANNGWAVSKPLPIRDFKWKRVMLTKEEIEEKRKRKVRVDP